MSPTYALLPSPLLGAVAWGPVADALRGLGADVVVVDVPPRVGAPGDVLAAFCASLDGVDDVVLVPHSNAGLYAPAIADAVDAAGTVYVDAALPPRAGEARLAPPDFYAFLTTLVGDDGLLPPWTTWWNPSDLDVLFPSIDWRARVEAAQPRLPLAYFRATVAVPDAWQERPSAYLAFGDTYADEVAAATALGWPLSRLDGASHLHLLHDPETVAAEVVRLAGLVSALRR